MISKSFQSSISYDLSLDNASLPRFSTDHQQQNITLNDIKQMSVPIFAEKAFSQQKLPILISGAGIAGLALANALSNLNDELEFSQRVPYIIIERDAKSDSRNQGYGLTIRRKNAIYMKNFNVLPNIHERMVTLTGGYEDHMHNGNGKPIQTDLKEDKSKLKKVVARGEVRDAFLETVGKNYVLWDTMVTDFKKTPEGIIVNITSNGEEKQLLVANLIAADGVNSKIRNQVVKDNKKYMKIVGVFGRLPNASATKHLCHEFQVDDNEGWRMFSKPFNVENYNWQMYFPWNEEDKLPDNSNMIDYISSELTYKGWDMDYINFVKQTDPDTMRCSLLYDRDPIPSLDESVGAITFIGDAAHPISPYQGRGANLALKGVRIFTQVAKEGILAAAKNGTEVDWSAVNRIYEEKHWPGAGRHQTNCRDSVKQHHFAGYTQ